MGRHRHKWITAGLALATGGFWGTVLAAPALGIPRDPDSDCRGLGVAAVVLLGLWLMFGNRVQRIEKRQEAQDSLWDAFREGRREAEDGRASLRLLAGGR